MVELLFEVVGLVRREAELLEDRTQLVALLVVPGAHEIAEIVGFVGVDAACDAVGAVIVMGDDEEVILGDARCRLALHFIHQCGIVLEFFDCGFHVDSFHVYDVITLTDATPLSEEPKPNFQGGSPGSGVDVA